jgi:hypothetical protein
VDLFNLYYAPITTDIYNSICGIMKISHAAAFICLALVTQTLASDSQKDNHVYIKRASPSSTSGSPSTGTGVAEVNGCDPKKVKMEILDSQNNKREL